MSQLFSDIQFLIPVILAAACLGWAAVSDLRRFLIPNGLSVALTGLFFLFIYVNPNEVFSWTNLLCAIAVLSVGIVTFAFGWMGAGDVKLFSALALWAGPEQLPLLLVVTALAGGLVGLAIAVPRVALAVSGGKDLSRARLLKRPIPYGVAIACGGLVLLGQITALQLA